MRLFDQALMMAGVMLLVSLLPLPVILQAKDQQAGVVAALFSPAMDRAGMLRAVIMAGGAPVQQGGFGAVIVAASDVPGFAKRLRAQGAWLVTDRAVLALCGVRQPIQAASAAAPLS